MAHSALGTQSNAFFSEIILQFVFSFLQMEEKIGIQRQVYVA